jgi:aspartate aminotransferase
MFSKRINNLLPSPTLSLDAKVKDLQTKGINIINLCLGEPDFDTPVNIKKSAIKAINENFTHYTLTNGLLDLRQTICRKLLRENEIRYNPQEIIVGTGSKQILYEALQVICDSGDEVIVPLPTWNTYAEQIKLAGAKAVFVTLAAPFKLTAKDIQGKLTKKTKVIILNSPANPTGAVIEKEEMEQIVKLAVEKTIFIISDEIYEKIIYAGRHISPAAFGEKAKKQIITINGVSKAYAMTGWRIGYAAGPKEIIEKMTDLQSQITSNANTIAQQAANTALKENQSAIIKMVNEFSKRRNFVYKKLSAIEQLEIVEPEGTFYFFVSIKKLLKGKYKNSNDWCRALLEKQHVAVVPGEAFFYPGFFRLSFTASLDNLEEATERIKKFIEKT